MEAYEHWAEFLDKWIFFDKLLPVGIFFVMA